MTLYTIYAKFSISTLEDKFDVAAQVGRSCNVFFISSNKKEDFQSMRDLAPEIYRQRAVIEGYPDKPLTAPEIKTYLKKLSDVLGMKTLIDPVTHRSDKYGEAAWIHWETSGAHFYTWDVPRLFFSVDIYTCKAFNVKDAVNFTQKAFNVSELVYKEF